MKNLYLVLTIVGAIIPYLFFFQFFQRMGINLPEFISSLFANGAAGGFAADLLFTSVVFWIFMFQQLRKKGSPKPWVFIFLNLTIGLSCAFPAYLYVRERPERPEEF